MELFTLAIFSTVPYALRAILKGLIIITIQSFSLQECSPYSRRTG
jgi:hypothetical protein